MKKFGFKIPFSNSSEILEFLKTLASWVHPGHLKKLYVISNMWSTIACNWSEGYPPMKENPATPPRKKYTVSSHTGA